jgi:hypothetical protein
VTTKMVRERAGMTASRTVGTTANVASPTFGADGICGASSGGFSAEGPRFSKYRTDDHLKPRTGEVLS